MSDVRQEADYATSLNRAYRFLTVAIVTKFASCLTGIGQYRTSLGLSGETATLDDVVEGGFLQLLAGADGLVSLVAVVCFCLWLARASAGGVVTLAKDGLPRRMGVVCALGVTASLLANVVSLGGAFVQAGVLFRQLLPEGAEAVNPLVIPRELPIVYFKVHALVLLAASALQLGAFLFFQTLIRRTAEAVASVPAPAVETPAQVPAGDAPAPESGAGFGWPEQPSE